MSERAGGPRVGLIMGSDSDWSVMEDAATALAEFEAEASDRAVKANIRRAIERVATQLGNTPTICRQSYIHPQLLEAYRDDDPMFRRIDPDAAAVANERSSRPGHRIRLRASCRRRCGH